MGPLKLPASGKVYVDSNCIIYGIEKIKPYAEVLDPMWKSGASGNLALMSSEIALLEALVRPVREKNIELQDKFRRFLLHSDEFSTVAIGLHILERAAQVRAETGLRTPDAIHAATALETDAVLFVTNDSGFRRVAGLNVAVLSELVDGE